MEECKEHMDIVKIQKWKTNAIFFIIAMLMCAGYRTAYNISRDQQPQEATKIGIATSFSINISQSVLRM